MYYLKKAFFILSLFPLLLVAQNKWSPRDSVCCAMKCRPSWGVGLDGKQSFISGQRVRVFGARYGLDYKKVGFYTGIYSTQAWFFSPTDSVHKSYSYVGSTFDYNLYNTWRWQLVSTFLIGMGNTFTNTKMADGTHRTYSGKIYPVELGINGSVRFLRYFGYSMGAGLRFSLKNGSGFTGPFYSAGLTFFTGTAWRDCKKVYCRIAGK